MQQPTKRDGALMRGKIPSRDTATKIRRLSYHYGEKGAATLFDISPCTVTRIAAEFPVLPGILFMVEAKLPELLADLDPGNDENPHEVAA